MRWVVLVAWLAGCDLVVGLERHADQRVSGTLVRNLVTNDEQFAPVTTTAPYPAGTVSIQVVLPDGAQQPVELADDGTFELFRFDENDVYRLILSIEGRAIEVQHHAPELKLAFTTLGRPNPQRVLVTKPTTLTFPTLGGSERLMTTGLWSESFTYDTLTGSNQIDWKTASMLGGRRGLLSAAQHDRMYYVDLGQVSFSGYDEIVRYIPRSIDMIDGQAVATNGPVTMTARDACVTVTSNRTRDRERLKAAIPNLETYADDAHVTAIPDASLGAVGELTLVGQTEYGAASDLNAFQVRFTNIFPGTTLLGSVGHGGQRTITIPGAGSFVVIYGWRQYQVLTTTTNCADTKVTFDASELGVPGHPILAGVPLETDGVAVAIDRGRNAELVWSQVAPGKIERYVVSLLEVFVDPDSGEVTVRSVRDFITTEPRVVIDPGLMITGGFYLVQILGSSDQPDAANGDLSTTAFPYAATRVFSSMFQVQ